MRPIQTALVLCGSPASALRWQEEATQCGLSSLITGTGDISSVDVVITICKAWKLLNENTRDIRWESFVSNEPAKNVCTHFRESPYATEHIMLLSDWRALVKDLKGQSLMVNQEETKTCIWSPSKKMFRVEQEA